MAMIEGLVATLIAALASFVIHLAAHDFAELSPKLGSSLIRRASRMLPGNDRARYTEEWLADFEERKGVFAKLSHAFECLFCAHRMRRQSRLYALNNRVVRVEIAGVGEIELDGPTSTWTAEALRWVGRYRRHSQFFKPDSLLTKTSLKVSFAFITYKLRKVSAPNPEKMRDALAMFRQIEPDSDIKIWVNGRLVHHNGSKSFD